MTTMNISLPENLKGFVDSQVQIGGYSTSSEYIREDQKRSWNKDYRCCCLKACNPGSRLLPMPLTGMRNGSG